MSEADLLEECVSTPREGRRNRGTGGPREEVDRCGVRDRDSDRVASLDGGPPRPMKVATRVARRAGGFLGASVEERFDRRLSGCEFVDWTTGVGSLPLPLEGVIKVDREAVDGVLQPLPLPTMSSMLGY